MRSKQQHPVNTAVVDELETPSWERAGRVHDWRNHVPVFIKTRWSTFGRDTKMVLAQWAEELANAEVWD